MLEEIARQDPDLLLLMEVDDGWLRDLESGLRDWQRLARARGDNFGIALFSRLPIEEGQVLWLGPAQVRHAREVGGAVLLLGDLNTTPWSHAYRALERVSGLRDATRGHGVQPTWPNLPWPLRIPLDGALVNGPVRVRDVFVGMVVGSDHRPLVIDLALGT